MPLWIVGAGAMVLWDLCGSWRRRRRARREGAGPFGSLRDA